MRTTTWWPPNPLSLLTSRRRTPSSISKSFVGPSRCNRSIEALIVLGLLRPKMKWWCQLEEATWRRRRPILLINGCSSKFINLRCYNRAYDSKINRLCDSIITNGYLKGGISRHFVQRVVASKYLWVKELKSQWNSKESAELRSLKSKEMDI